jgi:hypothetical protein
MRVTITAPMAAPWPIRRPAGQPERIQRALAWSVLAVMRGLALSLPIRLARSASENPAMAPEPAVGLSCAALGTLLWKKLNLRSPSGTSPKPQDRRRQRYKVTGLKSHGRDAHEAERDLELFEDSLATFEASARVWAPIQSPSVCVQVAST